MRIISDAVRLLGLFLFFFFGTAFVQNDFDFCYLGPAIFGLICCLIVELVEWITGEEEEDV